MSTATQTPAVRHSHWFFTRISLFWVGLSFMWGALNIQVLPSVVSDMVGPDLQGTAIGAIIFVGLVIAIIVQPAAGALSDRARFRVGRRRPFMLAGVLVVIPFLVVIGLTPYYWVLFLAGGWRAGWGQHRARSIPRRNSGSGSTSGSRACIGVLRHREPDRHHPWRAVSGQFLAEGQVLPALLTIAVVLVGVSLMTWIFVREAPPPPPETYGHIWTEVRQRVRELEEERPLYG